jgi:Gpi18-like mannosyltransferase
MSNLLNDLKTTTQNSNQKIKEENKFTQAQNQNDYNNYDYSIQNNQSHEVLKPKTIFNQGEESEIVEIENPELQTNNNYFEETNSGYGFTNFGQDSTHMQDTNRIVTESPSFPHSNEAFEEKFKAQTFIPPILPTEIKASFDLDENESKIEIRPKNINNYFSELGSLLKPLFKLENIIFVAVCLIAFRIRLSFFPYISGDYGTFLKPWMEKIDTDGFSAFKEAFFNYTPLYVYILGIGVALKVNFLFWVKIVSVFFDFVLSYFVAKIVEIKYPKLFKLVFMVTLMLPATIFNGSMWGQCDSIYGSFVVASLYFLLKNDHFKSAFFFALSLCLKLQGVFFAPVFLILIITKNLPKKFILTVSTLFVVLYLLMIFPISQNFIFGSDARPLLDSTSEIKNGVVVPVSKTDGLLTIYTSQSKAYSNLVMGGIPNVYQWISNDKYEYFYQAGLGIALVGVLLVAYYFVNNKITNLDNDAIIKLSLLSVLIVPYLLPKMHERYMFLADILAITYSFWFPKKFWVGVIVSIISLSVYISGVIGGNIPQILNREFAALWILGIIVYVFYDLIKGLKKDKVKKEFLES